MPKHVRKVFAEATQHQHCVAVVMLDLDGFKQVNDRLGHATGDRRPVSAGNRPRLALGIRDCDPVCRYDGDEFLLILPQVDRASVRLLVETLSQQVSEPFALDGQTVSVTLSSGVAMFPEDGKDSTQLLRAADAAMYRRKPKLPRKPKIRLPSASSQVEQAFGA